MLVIRLTRVGKKKQPGYRLVVQEKQRDPWGHYQELLGHYDPLTDPATLTLEKERVAYWISKGAQPSDTVWNLLVGQGLVKGDKRRIVQISRKKQAAAKAAAPAPAA